MNISYLGILLTLIFGLITVIGIIISMLVINKPKLKYYQVDPKKLFSNKIEELTKIKIFYKNKKIDDKIIFFQALIINEGNCDIDSNSIYEPLRISFKEPFKILDAFIDEKYTNIILESKNDILQLTWDLLKRNEYFIINIILSYENEDENLFFERNLRLKHTIITSRIKNIYQIKKESFTKMITNKDRIKTILLMTLIFPILIQMSFSFINLNQINREIDLNNKNVRNISQSLLQVNSNLLEIVRKYNEITTNLIFGEISASELDEELENIKVLMIESNTISNRSVNYVDEENNNIIEYQDIDLKIIIVFFIAVIVFIIDIYLIINFLRKRQLSTYLK